MTLDDFRRIVIEIDTANDYIAPITLSAGDINGRKLLVKLTDNGKSISSDSGIEARLAYCSKMGQASGYLTMDYVDGQGTAAWECYAPGSALASGVALLCIQFWQGSDVVCSRVFQASVDRSVLVVGPGTGSDDALKEFYEAVSSLKDQCLKYDTAEKEREQSFTSAIDKSKDATFSAEKAAKSANDAASAANSATADAKAALPLGLCVVNGKVCQRYKRKVQ